MDSSLRICLFYQCSSMATYKIPTTHNKLLLNFNGLQVQGFLFYSNYARHVSAVRPSSSGSIYMYIFKLSAPSSGGNTYVYISPEDGRTTETCRGNLNKIVNNY
jgi:hypothetical protein